MSFFTDTLQSGSEVLGNLINSGRNAFDFGANVGKRIGSADFFGRETQRIKVGDSTVSNSPYEGTGISKVGSQPRPKSSEAFTLTNTYKNWWDAKYDLGNQLWNNVKATYMGIKVQELSKGVMNNLGQTANTVLNTSFNTVTDKIINTLGLSLRPADGNREQQNNQPGGVLKEKSFNKLTAGNPGTVEVIGDFMDALYNPDNKGTYNIGFPSTPMSTSLEEDVINNNSDKEPMPAGLNMNMVLLGIALIGGVAFLRKRGK